jgi:hypothetical protein
MEVTTRIPCFIKLCLYEEISLALSGQRGVCLKIIESEEKVCVWGGGGRGYVQIYVRFK